MCSEVNSNDHFVFSLTNNDKFLITKNQTYCICLYMDKDKYGPAFGGGHDFHIHSKANENNSSYTNINYTYTNTNYTHGDSNSQIKFAGGYNFKVK
jgi:hypothetical protein